MKIKVLFFALLSISSIALLSSCEKEKEVIIDSALPQGTFAAAKSGNFIEQNGTGSAGVAQLGTDENGTQFLKFGSDFTTNFATGTVTVYLSTSMDFMADPGNGNVSITPADVNGEWVFDKPFYILLNLAVGGSFVGPPNSQTVFPQTMLVDYVRVYK